MTNFHIFKATKNTGKFTVKFGMQNEANRWLFCIAPQFSALGYYGFITFTIPYPRTIKAKFVSLFIVTTHYDYDGESFYERKADRLTKGFIWSRSVSSSNYNGGYTLVEFLWFRKWTNH